MRAMRILAVVVLVGFVVAAPYARAQSDGNEERNALGIAAQFTRLAGSEENALALVKALRDGERVTLVAEAGGTKVPVMTTFELPGGKMSWDNVMISLALARDSLTRAGILYPTGEELEAALLGGDVATTRGSVRLTGALIR
jgi:hypothetical protein